MNRIILAGNGGGCAAPGGRLLTKRQRKRGLEFVRFGAHGPVDSTGPVSKDFSERIEFYRLLNLLFHIDHDAAADLAVYDRMGGVDDAVKADFARQRVKLGHV